MMERFAGEYIQQMLATATDQELLEFIGKQVLSRLTSQQKIKLRAFIDQQVPWPTEREHAR